MEDKILSSLIMRIKNVDVDLLKDLIEDVVIEVKEYINIGESEELPKGCNGIVKDLVAIRCNKQGSEGLQSESYSGISQTYVDDYPKEIKRKLKRYRKLPRKR